MNETGKVKSGDWGSSHHDRSTDDLSKPMLASSIANLIALASSIANSISVMEMLEKRNIE
jgi:hypothetical protein